jgi:hypothetical protein
MDINKKMVLTLSMDECNLIRDTLVALPFNKVAATVLDMDMQIGKQLKESESVTQGVNNGATANKD